MTQQQHARPCGPHSPSRRWPPAAAAGYPEHPVTVVVPYRRAAGPICSAAPSPARWSRA